MAAAIWELLRPLADSLSARGGGGASLHWAIGQEIATKCYQIDVSGVTILHVLCHGTGVAFHREVRVTIDLDVLCSGLITPFYITSSMKTRLKRFENDFALLSSITVVSGGGQLTTPMTSFDVIGVGEWDSK